MTTPKCEASESCGKLKELLLDAGVDETDLKACPTEERWPCEVMLQNAHLLYKTISPRIASKTVRFVAELFGNKPVFTQDVKKLLAESPFHCPEIDVDVYQPCQVNSCVFFTPNRWTRNCVLYYRVRHDRDLLSLNELAFLLRNDVGTLRAQLNKAMRSLGHGALKETIVQEGVHDQVAHLEVEQLCVVCEKNIVNKTRHIVRAGLTYCSKECYRAKPPVVVNIEKEFGLPVARVLELCVSKFGSTKNMCGALNVGQNVFLDLCKQYGVDTSTLDD